MATTTHPQQQTSIAQQTSIPEAEPSRSVLTDALLQRCRERAPVYDRENRFFAEDFEELRDAGYLRLPLPKEFGGPGFTLAQVAREQRRLAYFAPATALGINMHVYWVGVAADLWRAGDRSLEWLLAEAANGAVFAAGHAESGNDVPVLLSTSKAERVDGGYRITGHKAFGSLTPVWTFMGLHGMDMSDPAAPKIVHVFMSRGDKGYRIEDTWNVLGMRATSSQDTILDGVFIPDSRVVRVIPAGAAGVDLFILAVFAWALLGFGNIYLGMAQYALDRTVDALKKKTSIALSRPMAYHAEAQHTLAEMGLELEGIAPHLDRIAEDWSNGVNYGHGWPAKIFAAKYHAVEGAWRVVDHAFELAGGFGIFQRSGFERLLRDARLGRIHPANSALTHELVAKTLLGISPDETPRWG